MEKDGTSANFKLTSEELNCPLKSVFKTLLKLGQGSFGSVFKASHIKSNDIVAIKQVSLSAQSDLKEIVKEISIMQQCDSKYVIKYYGSYYDNSDLWIIMEYCCGGSVLDIMKFLRTTLNEEQIGRILFDVLRGLEYMHLRRKIHRDIKAGNILLAYDGTAKLADFGVSGQLNDTLAKRSTVVGTPYWMAPEIIQEIGYEYKADIWSLGITCIEMGEGKPPFSDFHPMRAIFMIPSRPPPTFSDPSKFSTPFNNFVGLCLVKNPKDRANSTQLLRHEFIAKYRTSLSLKMLLENVNNKKNKKRDIQEIDDELEFIENLEFEDFDTMFKTALNINKKESPKIPSDDENFMTCVMNDIIAKYNDQDCGTMVVHNEGDYGGTMVVHNEEEYGGTMVVKDNGDADENDGTMVFVKKSDNQPEFMKHIDEESSSNLSSDTGKKNSSKKRKTKKFRRRYF